MVMKNLREIANAEALQVRETVKGNNNGYPSGIKEVITGFFDWEQIEDFIKRYGGEAIMLHKRDGWQMYERGDAVYEPMEITAEMYGDNYSIILKNDYEDEHEFIRDFLLPILGGVRNIETFAEIVDNAKAIWSSVDSIRYRDSNYQEGVVIYNSGKLGWREYETIDIKCIGWSHDTHDYEIGVIIEEDDND